MCTKTCCSGWRAQVLAPSRRDPPCWTRSSPSSSPPACSSPFSLASSSTTPFQVRYYIKYGGVGRTLMHLHVVFNYWTEARFFDEIQTKVWRVFLLAIHSHLYSFALRFIFLQTHSTSYSFSFGYWLYTVKEKEENPIENHPLSYGLRNLYRNLKSENSASPTQRGGQPLLVQ